MDQMVDVVQRQDSKAMTSDGKMGEDILVNIVYSECAIG